MCDFDVTSSCDVISPDHFVRGFYNSSFRRCRPNFFVLQKEYKILVHNLFIYEKLEQSTHWIIQKKWGKDFTFGSDCTVAERKYSRLLLRLGHWCTDQKNAPSLCCTDVHIEQQDFVWFVVSWISERPGLEGDLAEETFDEMKLQGVFR